MDELRSHIRPSDVALAAVTTGLGIWLMVENIVGADDGTRVDSHSWLLVPVFMAATLPVLFRRVNMIAVILATAAAMAVHVAAFGWLVRCGAGLPLALVLAYSAGRLIGPRAQSVLGLVLTIAVQALVLVKDSAAGIEILPVTAVLGLATWGVGLLVRTLVARRSGTPAPMVPASTVGA